MPREEVIKTACTVGVCAFVYYFYRRYCKSKAKKFIQSLGVEYLGPLEWKTRKQHLSVATFNTLRKETWHKNVKCASAFIPEEVREWKFRRKRIWETLESLECDLLCLQEAEITSIEEDYVKYLNEHGYDGIYPQVKNRGDVHHPHTKPSIFYKRERIELLWHKHRSRAVLAEFMFKRGGQRFFVINCHCQKGPQSGSRFLQIRSWLQKLEHEIQQRQNVAKARNLPSTIKAEDAKLIFLGDFNSTPPELCHRFMNLGHIPNDISSQEVSEIIDKHINATHSFAGLTPAYDLLSPYQPWTIYAGPMWGRQRLDYIYTKGMKVERLRNPLREDGRVLTGVQIPNKEHPSDHLPLAVELSFE